MRKPLLRKQDALEKLLREKNDLEAQIGPLWQEIRMLRLAAIRGDDDPGELPQFFGLDDQQRSSQLKRERLERSNHEIDTSPAHLQGLRELNDAA
jgi:hypothetical protein